MQQLSSLETDTMGFRICMEMAIAWCHVIDRFSVCLHQGGEGWKLIRPLAMSAVGCMGVKWQEPLLHPHACIQGSAGAPAVQRIGASGALVIPLHCTAAIKLTRPVSMKQRSVRVHSNCSKGEACFVYTDLVTTGLSACIVG